MLNQGMSYVSVHDTGSVLKKKPCELQTLLYMLVIEILINLDTCAQKSITQVLLKKKRD